MKRRWLTDDVDLVATIALCALLPIVFAMLAAGCLFVFGWSALAMARFIAAVIA